MTHQLFNGQRPFALRLVTVSEASPALPDGPARRFDPQRQVSVTADGTPHAALVDATTTPTYGGPVQPRDCEASVTRLW